MVKHRCRFRLETSLKTRDWKKFWLRHLSKTVVELLIISLWDL